MRAFLTSRAVGLALLLLGLTLVVGGLILVFAERLPGMKPLPGDIVIRREGWSLYFPIVTCVLLSLLLTLLVNLLLRRR